MGKTRPRLPCPGFPLRRAWVGVCLVATLGAGAFAQEGSSVEEPDWDATAAQDSDFISLEEDLTAPDDHSDAISLEEDLLTPDEESGLPSPPVPEPREIPETRAITPTPPKPSIPSQAIERKRELEQTTQDILSDEEEPEVTTAPGVPEDDNWNLPDFTSGADPFFQMEGLKIRLGELQLRFALNLSFRYDDNIYNLNEPRVEDYITTISPTIIVAIGDFVSRAENYFVLSYSPQPEFFAINSDEDTINEFLNISGQYAFSRLVTSGSFEYSRDSAPTVDQSGRNEVTRLDFELANSYAIGAKTFLEFTIAVQNTDYVRSTDYTTVSANLAIAYQTSPKTRVTLGPLAGITYVDGGGEQPFQGVNLSLTYDTFKKLSFTGYLGVQARQFRGPNPSGQEDFISPVFGIAANYSPTSTTSMTLDVSRSVQNSGLVNGQSVIVNSVDWRLQQIFLSRFTYGLTLGYSALQYQGTGLNDRTDNSVRVGTSIGYTFWKESCTVSISYSYGQRISEIESREYYGNTIGTSIAIKF